MIKIYIFGGLFFLNAKISKAGSVTLPTGKIEIPIRLIQTGTDPVDVVMGLAASLVGFLNDLR